MNHNDINRQCAEAMGWAYTSSIDDYSKHPLEEFVQTSEGVDWRPLPDFCNDWNAMRILREYAKDHDFILNLTEETKGTCYAEFISRKIAGGYFCEDADTFTEAAALAFRKCFGKEKEDG
jgi:hypothetical protein